MEVENEDDTSANPMPMALAYPVVITPGGSIRLRSDPVILQRDGSNLRVRI